MLAVVAEGEAMGMAGGDINDLWYRRDACRAGTTVTTTSRRSTEHLESESVPAGR